MTANHLMMGGQSTLKMAHLKKLTVLNITMKQAAPSLLHSQLAEACAYGYYLVIRQFVEDDLPVGITCHQILVIR